MTISCRILCWWTSWFYFQRSEMGSEIIWRDRQTYRQNPTNLAMPPS